jgi:hypothetical protein
MSEEAQAATVPDDLAPQLSWKIIRAKLLAQRGQIRAGRRLINQVAAALPASAAPELKARVLAGQAEVARFAGDFPQAEQHLLAALRIYQASGLVALAEQIEAAMASLVRAERAIISPARI